MHYAERPLIGVSSCLLGHEVRYDGSAKRDRWIVERLGEFVDFQPHCPEMAIGLGTPRPTLRLTGAPEAIRVVRGEDATFDVTDALRDYARRTAAGIGDVSGYIFKSKSPSCGMERVKLYAANGYATSKGMGAYAATLMAARPNLPCEEEGRLNDPVLRENFVNRVFAYRRWQTLRGEGIRAKSLIEFHARHKYLIMAHSQAAYRRLGRLLSNLKRVELDELADVYEAELMTALKRRVSRKRHVNALAHIQGYLKRRIDAGDKRELADSIEDYRREVVPLIVPMKLLRHYFRRHPDDYIDRQWYLDPYPEALGLRNEI